MTATPNLSSLYPGWVLVLFPLSILAGLINIAAFTLTAGPSLPLQNNRTYVMYVTGILSVLVISSILFLVKETKIATLVSMINLLVFARIIYVIIIVIAKI